MAILNKKVIISVAGAICFAASTSFADANINLDKLQYVPVQIQNAVALGDDGDNLVLTLFEDVVTCDDNLLDISGKAIACERGEYELIANYIIERRPELTEQILALLGDEENIEPAAGPDDLVTGGSIAGLGAVSTPIENSRRLSPN